MWDLTSFHLLFLTLVLLNRSQNEFHYIFALSKVGSQEPHKLKLTVDVSGDNLSLFVYENVLGARVLLQIEALFALIH